jgi:1,4-dihydroxy-6-naphthoate synthase
MTCVGSIGDSYGPIIVSSRKMNIDDLKSVKIAVPGSLTTARLALKIFLPEGKEKMMNFDEILPAVMNGNVDAGLIIHEGQLSYMREGVYKVVDLGEWWGKKTGLPLPLGGNAVRRDVPDAKEIARLIKESIVYSLTHEDEALDYALSFGRGLDSEEAKKFIRMYVNDFTVHIGERGKKAVDVLLGEGYEAGILGRKVEIDWIEV